jgi:hypothetical protein
MLVQKIMEEEEERKELVEKYKILQICGGQRPSPKKNHFFPFCYSNKLERYKTFFLFHTTKHSSLVKTFFNGNNFCILSFFPGLGLGFVLGS